MIPATVAAATSGFHAPHLEYGALSPILVVFGAALVAVLVEAFVPAERRRASQIVVGMSGLIGAFIAVILLAGTRQIAAEGAIAVDGPTLFIQGTLLLLAMATVLLLGERSLDAGGSAVVGQAATVPGSKAERALPRLTMQHEVFPLTLFATGGMLTFVASNDLLMMFVALEVLSLPLYLMCGLARRRRLLSQEAAMKYFLLGAFSSAFFLYGLALVYGYAGSVGLGDIAAAAASKTQHENLLLIGIALLGMGLLFKIGAVPFQSWIPDVYQGAPTPVTAFMSSATKVAAFGALLRVYYVAFGGMRWDWRPMIWGVAILTMVVGTILAITQTDVKRLLAYSSVAHAGFILTGVAASSVRGLSSTMFYLAVYGFMVLGSFALVTLVRDADGEATHLSRWQGLGRKSPLVASVFALFLLAMAGIPFTSGFAGKYAVFTAAAAGGAVPLVIIGVIASAAAAFFYIRVIVLMFFQDPAPDGPTVAVPSAFTSGAVAVGAAITLVLGVIPQPVLDLADRAALFVR